MLSFNNYKNIAFFKINLRIISYALFWAFFAQPSFANISLPNGFYYQSQTDRYFSDGTASFTIRPTGDSKYLERIEVSIDNGAFSKYKGKINFSTEGLHTVRFRAADPVLNWSPMQSFQVIVDKTSPVSKPIWSGTTYKRKGVLFISSNTELRFSTTDNLSGISKVLWQKGGKVSPFPGKLKFKKQGPQNVKVSAVDFVGNRETWYNLSFTVDGSAPQTRPEIKGFSYKSKDSLFIGNGSLVVLIAKDSGSGVGKIQYKINSGPVLEYAQPISISSRKVVLKFRAVDQVGNYEAWKSIALKQDTISPIIKLVKKGRHIRINGKLYAKPGFNLRVSATDAQSGIKRFLASRDGGAYLPASKGVYSFNKPGEYYVRLRAIDNVDNISDANPQRVVVDNSPPVTKLTSTNKLVERGGIYLSGIPNRIEITGKDKGVGLARVEVSYDGKKFKEIRGPISLATWKRSRQTLYYRGVDRLGNTEVTRKMTIQIRSRGPKVDLFVETGNNREVPLSSLKSGRLKTSFTKTTKKQPIIKKTKKKKRIASKKSKRKAKKSKRKPANKKKRKK